MAVIKVQEQLICFLPWQAAFALVTGGKAHLEKSYPFKSRAYFHLESIESSLKFRSSITEAMENDIKCLAARTVGFVLMTRAFTSDFIKTDIMGSQGHCGIRTISSWSL